MLNKLYVSAILFLVVFLLQGCKNDGYYEALPASRKEGSAQYIFEPRLDVEKRDKLCVYITGASDDVSDLLDVDGKKILFAFDISGPKGRDVFLEYSFGLLSPKGRAVCYRARSSSSLSGANISTQSKGVYFGSLVVYKPDKT